MTNQYYNIKKYYYQLIFLKFKLIVININVCNLKNSIQG